MVSPARALFVLLVTAATVGCRQRDTRDPAAGRSLAPSTAPPSVASAAAVPLASAITDSWPAWAPGAAWRMLKWGMTQPQVEQALARSGVRFEAQQWGKMGGGYLKFLAGPWEGTVYFHERTGMVSQVRVQGDRLTRADAEAARRRVGARLGPPLEEQPSTEHLWRKEEDTFLRAVVHRLEGQWSVLEEWHAPSPRGFGALTWGITEGEAQRALEEAGYTCQRERVQINPCEMPNPPPDCTKPEPSLGFSRAGQRGSAGFAEAKLVQITVSQEVPDRARGDARIREIEGTFGAPFRSTETVLARWRDATTETRVELDHVLPEESWALSESYTPANRE